MTVKYECHADTSDATAKEIHAAEAALDKEHYDWYLDENTLVVEGETEVDGYSTNAAEIADEIEWILWNKAGIDADAYAEEVEFEPDWDRMTGGYDYIWN